MLFFLRKKDFATWCNQGNLLCKKADLKILLNGVIHRGQKIQKLAMVMLVFKSCMMIGMIVKMTMIYRILVAGKRMDKLTRSAVEQQ